MQSCDCCCRYNHRQIPRHVECDGKRMLTSPPPLRCQSDSNNNNGHNENFNRSNSSDKITHDSSPDNKFEDRPKPFSIDAILSRPVKSEISRDPKQELHVSHKMRTQRESVSPPCLYRSCHSPSSIARSCCSPSRLSPEPLSPPHPDHLPIYRHSRFVAPMRNFHFEKHSYNEPTMVHMEKQHFTTGCAGCPDCKMSEMRRFRLGKCFVRLFHYERIPISWKRNSKCSRKRINLSSKPACLGSCAI